MYMCIERSGCINSHSRGQVLFKLFEAKGQNFKISGTLNNIFGE